MLSMNLGKPMDFREALDHEAVKRLLPTTLKSADLMKIDAGIRERSRFAAQVTDGQFLTEADTLIKSILGPEPDAHGVITGMDDAQARVVLRDYLTGVDYHPEPGKEGTIEDLGADSRLNLILKTNVQMAHGYGAWKVHQTPSLLENFPAVELIRGQAVKEPRDWPDRWEAVGLELTPGDNPDYPEAGGRMIALVNDERLLELSDFGLPYPPLAFGSQMIFRPLDRDECAEAGFELPEEPQEPQDRDFGEDIQASLGGMEAALQQATVESLLQAGLDVVFGEDGILRFAAEVLGNEEPGHEFHGNQWVHESEIEQPKLPSEGSHPAIRLKGGTILPADGWPTHQQFLEHIRIHPDDVESGGWLKDGTYSHHDRSDTMRWKEQKQAQIRVIQKYGKGNPGPDDLRKQFSNEGPLTTCQACGRAFDYGQAPEVGMGAVRCPQCQATIDQAGQPAAGTIFLIRHGATANTETGRITGWSDVPLTDAGRAEAEAAGCELADYPLSRIYCSPLQRALETAYIVAGMQPVLPEVVTLYGLMPWHLGPGIEGWPANMMAPRVRALVMAPDDRPFGGETFNEFKERVIDAWGQIVADQAGQNIAVVTHHRVTRLLAAWVAAGSQGYAVDQETFLAPGDPTGSVVVALRPGQEAGALANAFNPDQERDASGKWTAAGAFAAKHGLVAIERTGQDEKGKGGKWQLKGGGEVPEHARGIIPPAYHDAHINPDPKADVQGVGTDDKGRTKRFYSQAFEDRMAAKKFERIEALRKEKDNVFSQTDADLTHSDPKVRENAACLKLIQTTGIRPGSETDTGAKVQAYGATTLEGRHVHVEPDGSVRLRFIGKGGKSLDIPVEDRQTAEIITGRSKAAGPSGKLFSTDDTALRDYAHEHLDTGRFKTKDFRTLKGTEEAAALVRQNPAKPSNFKEYKRRVMEVAKRVAEKLGNTPAIALQRYISPTVFSPWKIAA